MIETWPERGGASRRAAGASLRRPLFDEHAFTWPEPPDAFRFESKLPHIWFLDAAEARAYLLFYVMMNSFGFWMFVSGWVLHNRTLQLLLAVPLVCAWLGYQRIWISLCKRAQPPLSRLQWFSGNYLNPRVWHCLRVALSVVGDQ